MVASRPTHDPLGRKYFHTTYNNKNTFLRFENKKNATLRFFEVEVEFEVSDFADFSLDRISTAAQKQCMFIIYMALVAAKRTRNLIECGI